MVNPLIRIFFPSFWICIGIFSPPMSPLVSAVDVKISLWFLKLWINCGMKRYKNSLVYHITCCVFKPILIWQLRGCLCVWTIKKVSTGVSIGPPAQEGHTMAANIGPNAAEQETKTMNEITLGVIFVFLISGGLPQQRVPKRGNKEKAIGRIAENRKIELLIRWCQRCRRQVALEFRSIATVAEKQKTDMHMMLPEASGNGSICPGRFQLQDVCCQTSMIYYASLMISSCSNIEPEDGNRLRNTKTEVVQRVTKRVEHC